MKSIKIIGLIVAGLVGCADAAEPADQAKKSRLALLAQHKKIVSASALAEYTAAVEGLKDHDHLGDLVGVLRAALIPFDRYEELTALRNTQLHFIALQEGFWSATTEEERKKAVAAIAASFPQNEEQKCHGRSLSKVPDKLKVAFLEDMMMAKVTGIIQ